MSTPSITEARILSLESPNIAHLMLVLESEYGYLAHLTSKEKALASIWTFQPKKNQAARERGCGDCP
jgi:hypothetical protein